MTEFTKDELAKLKPLQVALDNAKFDANNAAAAYEVARKAHDDHTAKIGALGSEPQPADCASAAEWQTAQSEYRFALAKLQPGLQPLADKVAATSTAMQDSHVPIANAQIALDQGRAQILVDRVAAAGADLLPQIVRAMRARAMCKPGFTVDLPRGVTFAPAGAGLTTVGFGLNVDLADYRAD